MLRDWGRDRVGMKFERGRKESTNNCRSPAAKTIPNVYSELIPLSMGIHITTVLRVAVVLGAVTSNIAFSEVIQAG